MKFSARLQLLACLMVYASSAHAIMVKYGTKEGPIVPPTPEPTPSPQPHRAPAPVWEERQNDTPDPNANWQPFFIPQKRITNVVMSVATAAPPLTSAQRFVSHYIPNKPVRSANPAVLSAHNVPGVGLQYFYPSYTKLQPVPKQEDAKYNHIETDLKVGKESASDFEWAYEKDASRRIIRNNQEGVQRASRYPYHYEFPVYVQPRHR